MPSGDYPDDFALKPIEEAVWVHDDLAIRQFWKLGNSPSGVRKPFEATEPSLHLATKGHGGCRIFAMDVSEPFEKLPPR